MSVKCLVECSSAFTSSITTTVTPQREKRVHSNSKLQSSSSVCFWQKPTYTPWLSLCLLLVLRATRASQLRRQFSRVAEDLCFFGRYESEYWAFMLWTHRGTQFCVLERPSFLSHLFVITFWTCLYLHYVHVAFTQGWTKKIPKHICKKTKTLNLAKVHVTNKALSPWHWGMHEANFFARGFAHQLITMRRK